MHSARVGQRISHYEVTAFLGGGGMGVVYRAEDTRLRRSVALKFLPPSLTRDPDAKRRFVTEAQAASALDHPNVCTIYDIEETPDGEMLLAMAYYDGETLKHKISRGPLPLDDAIEWTVQTLQGLRKAHAASIVHRDIKPANLMITADGLVKVVDFGIAKLLGHSELTQTGTVLGSVAYMSPEQAQGQAVDHRTDLWSVGVVLHEMVTGTPPFKGDSAAATGYAIVHEQTQPLSALRSGVPRELDRIVARALAKRAEDRYQSAADFLTELRLLQRASDTVTLAGESQARNRDSRRARPAWLLPAALAVVVAGATTYSLLPREASAPQVVDAKQLTAASGIQDFPSLSPDGRALVYTSNESGNQDIWVTSVDGSRPVNRTADFAGQDTFPSWSSDGQTIAFWSARDGGGYYVMPALGGTPRLALKTGSAPVGMRMSRPQWSRDAKTLACVVFAGDQTFVDLVTLATGDTERIALPGMKGGTRMDLSWSRDERFFAYVDVRDTTAQVTRLLVLEKGKAEPVAVTDGLSNAQSPNWTPDGKGLYYLSNRGGSIDLWLQPIGSGGRPEGELHQLTTGIGMLHMALSADGTRLAYSRGRRVANVWSAPILPDRPSTWADAKQLTFDDALVEFVDVSPDGKTLVISSDRSGNPDLWTLPSTGGPLEPLSTEATPEWRADYSPDGSQIGFYSYRTGRRQVWVMPAAGGKARQITNDDVETVFSGWAPDGKRVLTVSNRSGTQQIWITPVDGGESKRLTDIEGLPNHPSWSPDGKWVVFPITASGPTTLWRMPAAGGNMERLTRDFGWMSKWAPGGDVLFYTVGVAHQIAPNNVWSVSLADGVERQRTDLQGRSGSLQTTALATDGQRLFFVWGAQVGNVWLADLSVTAH